VKQEKYITIPELAKILGVSRIAIYNRVKKGEIPATKAGEFLERLGHQQCDSLL